jgi:bisanhydrobacterioruberin hydratase
MKTENRTIVIVIFVFLVGIILHIPCIIRKYTLFLTSPFLMIIGIIVLFNLFRNSKTKLRSGVFLGLAFLSTLLIEIIGVHSGKIFGSYSYGSTFWLKIAEVPVVIGFNWVILVLGSYSISKWVSDYLQIKSVSLQVAVAGGFLVLLDYFMEPVAVQLDYWRWTDGYIPLQNYIAWFIVSILQFYLIKAFKLEIKGKLIPAIYLIMLSYFMLLQVFLYPC